MLKFAVAEILSAHPSTHGRSTLLSRTAHRADFSHHPVRHGFLYVRSRAISSRCNDNFDEFPASELEKSWRTFIGKPVFVNHVNHDTARARGVIIDAALHRDKNSDATPDTWVEVLMEVDGARFPKLAQAIVEGKVYETSMGCDVDYSICSACGNKATRPEEYCRHIPASKGTLYAITDHKTGVRQTSPIREICYGLKFFENSLLVEPPADPTAQLLDIDASGLGKTSAEMFSHTTDYLPDLPGLPPHLNARTAASTDGYTNCDQGHCHWGTDGAAGMLIHHDGHVLLGRRADWVQHGGTWGIPGGALHEGETPADGAHREANEELGGLPALRHTHTHTDDHGSGWAYHTVIAGADHRFYPEGGDGETDEFRWVHPRAFPDYDLHPGFAASWPHLAPHVRGEHRTAAKTAAYDELSFEHNDVETGGSKWPTKRTVHAIHPEHGRIGTLSYYPPKRHGAALAIDRVETDPQHRKEGVASALMDHVQRTHPASRIEHGDRTDAGRAWWEAYSNGASKTDLRRGRTMATLTTEAASATCPHCGDASHSGYCTTGRVRTTDWSAIPHFDEIHRGFPVLLGAEDHEAVHDPGRSPAERGAHLLSILRDHNDALGSHWSTDAHFAHDTAQEGYGNDLSSGYEDDEQPHDTHVVVHASFPEHHHIETDIDNLRDGGVFGWNHRTPGDYPAEHEVPLKYNSPVHVSGVSFKHADDDRWTHARFGDDITHTALLRHHSGKLAAGPRHENPADHPFFKSHPVSAAHVVAHWAQATDEEKAQGKRWYADAGLLAKALAHTYAKGDVGKAAGVISAYSPRQNWAANMHNAARSLAEGRALGLGEGMSIMGQHQKSAQRIIDGEHYNTVLKAPKTNAFATLIHHGGIDPDTKKPMKHVVIDRHALSVAAGQRLSEDDVSGFPSSIPHYYNHVAKTYTDAADAISNTEGHSVAPHEVQAVTWMVRIRKNREEDRTARGGGGKGRVKNQDNNATKWRDTHRDLLPGGAGDDNMHMSSRRGARRRVEGMGDDGAYRMQHQVDSDFGAPLHDPTRDTFPKDVYEHPDWYTGAPDGEMVRSLHRAKGEPEKKIRIYRAVPQGVQHINTGDWVTLSREYAKQHVQSNVPGGHVLRIDAPAKHIISGGDDLQEWGYHGPTRIGMSSWTPKGYKHRYPGQTDPKTAEGARTGALDSVQAMADGSYRMMHQAPDEESGEPLHEVFGEHPDEPHTVYRAVPRHIHEINKGDWVTSHAEYAHQHALELEPGRRHGHVLQAQVPLRHLYTDHNDENEIGYTGPDLHNVDTHEHPDFPETMHSDEDEEENEEPPHYAGGAVHLSPQDHHFVHDPNRPVAERAHRLMHALPNKYDAPYSSMGHSTGYWDEDTDMAQIDAEERAEKLGGTGSHPATQFVLHSPLRADVTTGVSWAEHGPEKYYHSDFTHHRWPASDIDPDSGLRKHAYGETKAPAQIDTLREDECPVCGNTEGWDGIDCPVCQWSKPPDVFMDPDTSVARTMDLRGVGEDAAQQALQQGAQTVPGGVDQAGQLPADGDPAQDQLPGAGPAGAMEDPNDATADGEVRTLDGGVPDDGQAADPGQQQELSPAQMPPDAQDVLSCPACGFQTPAGPPLSSVTEDPSVPASAGPVAGDVCPNCGKATLLSAAEESGLTPPPEVAAIDPQAADAQAVPGPQQESEPQEAGVGDEQTEDDQEEPPEPKGNGKSKSPAVKRVSRRGQGGKTRR
jgi:8-oxo-dGTP pyrophosphatase MutT (NUDIX family)/predicted GNAT family acetyltransferase